MKIPIYRFSAASIFLSMLCLLFACEQEDIAQIDPNQTLGDPNSLYNQAASVSELSTFLDASVTAGLALRLREGNNNLTVFAPSNQAFEAAGINLADLDQNTLEDILNYHVIADSLPSGLLSEGRYATASGKFLTISTDNGLVLEPETEAASVINADISGSNGFIHVIDKVLTPPNELSQIVANNSDLSILAEAISRFPELVSAVEGFASDFTVFAPTNMAFENLLAIFPQYESLEDIPDHILRTILEYHLVSGELFAAEVSGDIATLQGENLIAEEVLSSVSNANVNASNGVAHVIDQVLIPPSVMELPGTVLGTVYFDPEARFTTLYDAVLLSGLKETLLSTGPFTVFAPTNDAFAASGIDLSTFEANDPALQSLLLYHVIAGEEVNAAELREGAVMAANEQDFYVNLTDMGSFVNASEIVLTDVQAENGIIHAIDETLLPPPGTLVETAQASGNFSILLRALEIAGLSETLNEPGPYTVFAPTDDAFQELLNTLGVESVEDLNAAQLQPILLYHVTNNRLFSFQVNEGVEIQTLNTEEDFIINQTIFPQPDDAPAIVETSIVQPGQDSELISTDIVSTNGIIHVIDKVLLP